MAGLKRKIFGLSAAVATGVAAVGLAHRDTGYTPGENMPDEPVTYSGNEITFNDVAIGRDSVIDTCAVSFFNDNNPKADYEMVIAVPGLTHNGDSFRELAEAYQESGTLAGMGASNQVIALNHPGVDCDGHVVAPRGNKDEFGDLTAFSVNRLYDFSIGPIRNAEDEPGDYVAAFLESLHRLTLDKRDADGNYDFTKHKPIAIVAHSLGALTVMEAINNNPQIDLKKHYGVTEIVLMSPAMPRQVEQYVLDSGEATRAAMDDGIVYRDPKFGAIGSFEGKPGRMVAQFCANAAGQVDPIDPLEIAEGNYSRPENTRVLTQLATPVLTNRALDGGNVGAILNFAKVRRLGFNFESSLGRPSVERGLFEGKGYTVRYIVGAQDMITRPQEVRELAQHLSGNEYSENSVLMIGGETHCMYYNDTGVEALAGPNETRPVLQALLQPERYAPAPKPNN